MTIDLGKLSALADGLRQKAHTSAALINNKWYTIQNRGEETVIGIYDQIGEGGVTAKNFLEDLAAITSKRITVQISSDGGQVYEGLAIYAGLAGHEAEITTDVISHAFSAASFIAQAGKYRKIRKNARMMVHNARIIGGVPLAGDADAVDKMAQALGDLAVELRSASDNLADIYAERSGKGDRAHWKALMSKETYFNAEDAVQNGLADQLVSADGTTFAMNSASAPSTGVVNLSTASTVQSNTSEEDPLDIFRAEAEDPFGYFQEVFK